MGTSTMLILFPLVTMQVIQITCLERQNRKLRQGFEQLKLVMKALEDLEAEEDNKAAQEKPEEYCM
jgi:hypothetical protein